MRLTAEITEQGNLRVKSPTLKPGDEIVLETCEPGIINPNGGDWVEIEKALSKADALDFPRRTHEEILRDLHESRR